MLQCGLELSDGYKEKKKIIKATRQHRNKKITKKGFSIMTDTDVRMKLDLIVALKAQRAEIDAQLEALTDSVKAEMDARGVKKLEAGERTATFSRFWTTHFDTAAFKKENAALYDSYTTEIPSSRFTVK